MKKAHVIGIGGVGMSATAKLLRDSGWRVTGSDEALYPPISTFLEQEGFRCLTPYAASNIPADADVIIIGKNAKLVPESNPEVAAAYKGRARIASFPEILGELSRDKRSVVVAGSYGKSSCAALLSHVLLEAGCDPSFFIGAIPVTPPTSARIGQGELFVFEGDEYPSSNTDPRSKFLHLHPQHLLLTPLAHDHVNVFPTVESYLASFKELLGMVPKDGLVVAAVSGALSKPLLSSARHAVVTYGLREGDFQAQDIVWGQPTRFTITHKGKAVVTVETTQLGEHSLENIVGVAAFVFLAGLADAETFARAIANFKGVVRRLDIKSEKTSVPIYEGFGSSVDKTKSAIAAMCRSFPERRLLVVFEPHTFSWRNKETLHWYDDAFGGADCVYLFNPVMQGAGTHQQATQAEIMERVKAAGVNAVAINAPQDVLVFLEKELAAQDAILCLSSGPLGGILPDICALAEERFPVNMKPLS